MKSGIYSYFSNEDSEQVAKIADGIYLWTHSNTQAKVRMLKLLFDYLGIDHSELELKFRE